MAQRWPATEQELAEPVVAWLAAQHWDVHQEVQLAQWSPIADIVAVQGQLVWVVEVKRSMTFALLAQAMLWRFDAHFVSVAVPREQGHSKARVFASGLFHEKGIGVLRVRPDGYIEDASPALNRKAQAQRLRDCLGEHTRTWAKAGNARGTRWTPFGQTCRNVTDYVAEHPGATMKEIVANMNHHYVKDSTARSSMLHWTRAGKIPGVEARRDGRELRFYPVAVTAAEQREQG